MAQTPQRIGLHAPLYGLIGFAILFSPFLTFTTDNPFLEVFYSPQIFFLVATLVILKAKRLHAAEIGLTLPHLKMIALPFLIFFILVLIMFFLHTFAKEFLTGAVFSKHVFTYPELILLFILAPICEELFFRGVLLHGLLENFNVKISILFSSLIFMATHDSLFLGTFTLGVITAILTLKSKSIIPGIIFHTLTNSLVWLSHNHFTHLAKLKTLLFL